MQVETRGRIAAATGLLVVAWVSSARAGAPCTLPEAYPIALEARAAVLGAGRGVIASEPAPAGSPLAAGEAVRQMNGAGVESCEDVERAAAEAFARGLPLLLAVERPGGLVPVLVAARALGAKAEVAETPAAGVAESAALVAVRDTGVVPAVAVADGAVPVAARAVAAVSPSDPAPEGAASARPDRMSEGAAAPADTALAAMVTVAVASPREPLPLPAAATARTELRAAAEQAVARLQQVEARATIAVPIAIYEREREEADAAIRQIDFGADDDTPAVRGVVDDVLAAYRTASEILVAKVEYQAEMHQTMRTRAPREMPYFSDGDVPRWVAAFPFLQEAVLAPPKDRRFLQSAGRWSPDRAVALLWAHARDETARLASWTAAG